MVAQLPSNIKNIEICDPTKFKTIPPECKEISKWIDLFILYGTHVATEIHLGLLMKCF